MAWRSSSNVGGGRDHEGLDHTAALEALFKALGEVLPNARGWEPIHCINPNHSDENASAGVNPLVGGYRCFGCGLRGDAFKLYQELFDASFSDAKDALQPDQGTERKLEPKKLVRRRDWL